MAALWSRSPPQWNDVVPVLGHGGPGGFWHGQQRDRLKERFAPARLFGSIQVSRQFGVDSLASRRLMRS
ncbi:hypothetical protein ABZ547_21760, partial [Streptomyces sparsogenes]|uniref:hypothetical protein n=1 Tax=Streptomyces sparsogenes TaxID=67365 RepID=UPI0033E9035D